MNQMSKIHIWIGTTFKEEDDYLQYFELDYSTEGDFEDPEYKLCQFCTDIGVEWYDEDFIGIIPLLERNVPITEILKEIPLEQNEIEKVLFVCTEIGLSIANAIFYYTDSELIIQKPYKDNYNDLKYIGVFDSSLQ
jgi:hypothetical protein